MVWWHWRYILCLSQCRTWEMPWSENRSAIFFVGSVWGWFDNYIWTITCLFCDGMNEWIRDYSIICTSICKYNYIMRKWEGIKMETHQWIAPLLFRLSFLLSKTLGLLGFHYLIFQYLLHCLCSFVFFYHLCAFVFGVVYYQWNLSISRSKKKWFKALL